MLTQYQMQETAQQSQQVVAEMELELLKAISKAVKEAVNGGSPDIHVQIMRIQQKYIPMVEEAVKRDLRAQFYINGQTEVDYVNDQSAAI